MQTFLSSGHGLNGPGSGWVLHPDQTHRGHART
jgi:hypothetical protein